MTYLATAFSLTLGAWRIRLRIDVDDALEPTDLALVRRGAAGAGTAARLKHHR